MCVSSPKIPPPAAAAPIVQPVEAPTLQIGVPDNTRKRSGLNKLRIDRTAVLPDSGSGLNIPQA
jgi:hypothetical protein